MSVLDCLSDELAGAWLLYYGDAIGKLEERNVVVEGPGDLDALIVVLDTIAARAEAGGDALEEVGYEITDIADLAEAMENMYDEEDLAEEAPVFYEYRQSDTQETCEQIIEMIWSKADPRATPPCGTLPASAAYCGLLPEDHDPLRNAQIIGDEPVELYLARARWALGSTDAQLAERLEAHVATAAIKCFGCKKADLPLGLRDALGSVKEEALRREQPMIWAALEDLGKATIQAEGWMWRTRQALAPNPDGDRKALPTLAQILGDPDKTPIVIDGENMRTMMALLIEAHEDEPERLEVIARYCRKFPMDFRAMFMLHLLNSGHIVDPDIGGHAECKRLDEAAYNYLRMRSVPAPKGPGRLGGQVEGPA